MKKKTPNPERTVTTLPILPGTLVVCGCTLAAFVLIFALMGAAGMITLPAPLAEFFGQGTDGGEDDGFSAEFLAALSGVSPDMDQANEALLTMEDSDLKALLLSCEPVDPYYQLCDVTWTDGTVFRRSQVYYIVSGGRIHAEIYPMDGTPKYLNADDTQLWLTEGGRSRLFPRQADSRLTPEGECGIPSLARIKEMIREAEGGKYALTLETVMESPCLRLHFTDPLTGIQEIYDILPDHGLIVEASSVLPGSNVPYYMMTTTSLLTDLTGLDEAIFAIPNTEKGD